MNAKTDKNHDPRRIAVAWLAAVRDGADLDAARPAAFARLESRDRGFARLLVMTALRRRGQIEALLDTFLDKRPPAKAAEAVALLHLGVAQLAFLETPPHAAVSTAVALAKTIAKGRFAGLVNAVLRRCARDGAGLIAAQDAARLNTPDWLWRSWAEAYGDAAARALADAHLGEAPLDVTVKADAAAWADRVGGAVVGPATVRVPAAGAVEALPGYADGAWWVQDRAAALPAAVLGDVGGLRVLDLCAAPGGKTAQLAAAGARVTAVDRDPRRMERLTENLRRLGLFAETRVADALTLAPDGEPFDAVLLDAPCSATGTIRRHPDLPWRRRPGDIDAMAAVQRDLLTRAATLVRPGGRIVFATCSLQPQEGAVVVDAVLAGDAPLVRDPVTANDAVNANWITDAGDVRTLPCFEAETGGMDGFFVARLARV
jgi:16S rRNA (cytosine967-C5)-methyltransferase